VNVPISTSFPTVVGIVLVTGIIRALATSMALSNVALLLESIAIPPVPVPAYLPAIAREKSGREVFT
jgi:hypothetical protein